MIFSRIFPDYMTKIHPTLVPFLLPVWHMTITGSDYLNLAAVVERLLVRIIYIKSLKKSQIVRRPCTTNSVIFFSLIQHKSIKEVNKKVVHGKKIRKMETNIVKLSYSAQKLQFWIFFHLINCELPRRFM